jgi:hypothetical protein
MAALPSVISIFIRAFTLYTKAYVPVLPFTLTGVLLAVLINFLLPPVLVNGVLQPGVDNAIVQILITMIIYSCILYGCNQIYHQVKFDYKEVLSVGLKRSGFLLISWFLIIFPFLCVLFLSYFVQDATTFKNVLFLFYALLLLVVSILTCIVCIYFFVSPVEMVVKKKGVLSGLKRSWQLTVGHWFKTFFVLIILIAPLLLLNFELAKIIGVWAGPLINLIFYPLGAALVVIYHELLEQDFQGVQNTQAVQAIPERKE